MWGNSTWVILTVPASLVSRLVLETSTVPVIWGWGPSGHPLFVVLVCKFLLSHSWFLLLLLQEAEAIWQVAGRPTVSGPSPCTNQGLSFSGNYHLLSMLLGSRAHRPTVLSLLILLPLPRLYSSPEVMNHRAGFILAQCGEHRENTGFSVWHLKGWAAGCRVR